MNMKRTKNVKVKNQNKKMMKKKKNKANNKFNLHSFTVRSNPFLRNN